MRLVEICALRAQNAQRWFPPIRERSSFGPVMLAIALKMLLHNKVRSMTTVIGIAVAFFLSAAQIGLMVGWCNTCSAIIRHADVDVWVMAEQNPAFDYGTPIPRERLYQVLSVPGVAWAETMFFGWMFW